VAASLRPVEHEDRARALNAQVDDYLRTHVPGNRRPEFLICRDHRTVWLVRWPNGSVKWEFERGAPSASDRESRDSHWLATPTDDSTRLRPGFGPGVRPCGGITANFLIARWSPVQNYRPI